MNKQEDPRQIPTVCRVWGLQTVSMWVDRKWTENGGKTTLLCVWIYQNQDRTRLRAASAAIRKKVRDQVYLWRDKTDWCSRLCQTHRSFFLRIWWKQRSKSLSRRRVPNPDVAGKTFHLNLTEIPLAQLWLINCNLKNKQKRPECTGMQTLTHTLKRLYNINYLINYFTLLITLHYYQAQTRVPEMTD